MHHAGSDIVQVNRFAPEKELHDLPDRRICQAVRRCILHTRMLQDFLDIGPFACPIQWAACPVQWNDAGHHTFQEKCAEAAKILVGQFQQFIVEFQKRLEFIVEIFVGQAAFAFEGILVQHFACRHDFFGMTVVGDVEQAVLTTAVARKGDLMLTDDVQTVNLVPDDIHQLLVHQRIQILQERRVRSVDPIFGDDLLFRNDLLVVQHPQIVGSHDQVRCLAFYDRLVAFQSMALDFIVRIHQKEIGPLRACNPLIAGIPRSIIRNGDEREAAVLGGNCLQNVRCRILRTVIYDDDLKIADGLCGNAFQSGSDGAGTIVGRNHNAEKRFVFH